MLRRIQQISGVGCYAECRSPQIQFERTSLVYGENCYGKTTLCDILRSLAEDSSAFITERATIPMIGGGEQTIRLSIVIPGQTQETTLIFRQGAWNSVLPTPLSIEVFDTDFIHRNVFTGLTVERQNRVNITQFVLGDAGVQIANRIDENNSQMRALRKSIRESESVVLRGISDLPSFIAMPCPGEITSIQNTITELGTSLEEARKLKGDLATVRNRPDPSECLPLPAIAESIGNVRRALSSTFEQVHLEAEALLLQHFEEHTANAQQSREWARHGASLIKDNECPFCGQEIVGSAEPLIKAYQAVFNYSYERYIRDTNSALEKGMREISSSSYSELPLRIEKNRTVLLQYPELSKRPDIQLLYEKSDELAGEVNRLYQEWLASHKTYLKTLEDAIQHKKEAVHIAVQVPDTNELSQKHGSLARAIADYCTCISTIRAETIAFKANLDSATVSQQIQALEQGVGDLELQKKRFQLDAACQAYVNSICQLESLEVENTQLKEDLDREQSSYLHRYFEAINRIYTALGSSRFEISVESNRRGNMPTIELRVSYKGVPITPDKIRTCFSESDRRALAFAIFWSRIEMLDAAKRSNTIVALDDPVTSFDDGRIDRTIRLIEGQMPQLRQVIICSHYSAYLKTFFSRLRGRQSGLLLASLCQDAQGTQIRKVDATNFTESSQERAFRQINGYINREHDDDILLDLRVFLEIEIRSRYYRTIVQNGYIDLQFAALLVALEQDGALSHDSYGRIDSLRITLNADHHQWVVRSREEKIGIATDVFQLIYDHL